MNSTTANQVIIGKMSFPQGSGQISLFDLPRNFVWLRHFSAEEIAEFLADLLNALTQSQATGDWASVNNVLEAWKATANIKADAVVEASVKQGLKELEKDQGISWDKLRSDLKL
ncbi:DUF6247 family protein [Desulfobacterales bacterium HSG2]|nr:DUF6247 family protein [Desulfobacterales bacterium HSG2]